MYKKIGSIIILFILFNLSTTFGATTVENNKITIKQQYIIPIAAFTADGNLFKLKTALSEGLDNGLTINEINEVLVQIYAYSGFPRSLNGLTTFMQLLDERKQKGINDPAGKEAAPLPKDKTSLILGTETQTYLVGAPVSGGVMEFAPAIDQFLKAHLFGDIFGRNNLDYQSREIATIAALASMDGLESQLQSHIHIGINIGLTEKQINSIIDILQHKVGEKEANVANKALMAELEKI
ncbi:4-carboxymuconolactone decarboxylase [Gammaproteobacteria bacterium ESL0073]|nr:4-carboxymuconolactone decarboxylase [Gammaproteobacteria bacterium ESL0073]